MDVKEDALRQILIKNIVTKRFGEQDAKKRTKIKEKMEELKNNQTNKEE